MSAGRKEKGADKGYGNKQDRIDAVLTNKWIGIPVFAAVMFGVFYISQSTVGTWLADSLVGWIEAFQGWAADLTEEASTLLRRFWWTELSAE